MSLTTHIKVFCVSNVGGEQGDSIEILSGGQNECWIDASHGEASTSILIDADGAERIIAALREIFPAGASAPVSEQAGFTEREDLKSGAVFEVIGSADDYGLYVVLDWDDGSTMPFFKRLDGSRFKNGKYSRWFHLVDLAVVKPDQKNKEKGL